jgi:hypothetical protein
MKAVSLCAVGFVACGMLYGQANVNEGLETTFLWVDAVNGSDSNPGTQSAPLRTIGAAASLAAANNLSSIGTGITILPGTYRERISLTAQKNQTAMPITFQAATPGTVFLSGAVQYSNWSVYAGNASIYTSTWPNRWGFCAPDGNSAPFQAPIVNRSELVIVNGAPLTQVLSLSQMVFPGTFFVDETSALIYVWPPTGTDMSAADVEVSTLSNLVTVIGFNGVVFRGLTFEYARGCRSDKAVDAHGASANVLFDSDTFVWNGGMGLSLNRPASNITILNSIANHNGSTGFHSFGGKNDLWQSLQASFNNWRGAQGAYYIWNSGGGHFFRDHNATLSGFTAFYNQTFAAHWDTDTENVSVDSLSIAKNVSGVLFEVSQGPISITNSHLCSSLHSAIGDGGLTMRNTEYVSLTGTSLYNNGNAQINSTGTTGGTSITNWETGQTYILNTQNLTLANNVIEGVGAAQQDFRYMYLGASQWTAFQSTLSSNNNTWWNASNSNPFTVPVPKSGTAVNFAGWQSVTGQDSQSTFAAAGAASSCPVFAGPPDWQLIVDNGVVTADAIGAASFNLTALDIGGFTGTATFAVDGVSSIPGAAVQFTPATIGIPGNSNLKFIAGPQTPGGTYVFTVLANVGSTTRTIALSATVPGAALAFSPSSLSFPVQQVGTSSAAQSVTVTNSSGASVPVSSITVSPGFTQTNNCPASLAINASCVVNVVFAPATVTSYSGTLALSLSGARPAGIGLTGTAGLGSTTTSLTSSANPSIYVQPVTFTATVTSPAGTPTGTVTFLDGTATLGAGTLNSAGVAVFTTGLLGVGGHSITAVYGGDSSFTGSTSTALGESIGQAPTAVALSASQAGAVYGTPLSFTAAVTPAAASGTVQFFDGTTPLGSAAVTAGTAVLTTAGLVPGVHAIAGVYSGDANYTTSSSAPAAVTVTQIGTATALSASANPVQADATSGTVSVTLTATVNPPSAGGSVQFIDGTDNMGTPVLLSGGTATTTVTLNVGVHSLSAVYGGDALDLPGTGTLSETVYNTPTGANVAVPVAASTITFATISALGITTITNTPVTDPTFPAPLPSNYQTGAPASFSTLSTTATASGSIVVCLSYAGVTYAQPSTLTLLRYDTTAVPPAWTAATSQNNTPASTTICGTTPALGNFVIVEDNTTSLALTSNANPSAYGQSVTLTATVTPSTAAGTVTFTDGSTNLGTATLSNATASLTTSKLTAGPHSIQASYTDTSGFFASSTASLTQTVSQAATTTALSSSASVSIYGQPVTFTATVSSAGGTPTGTVTFLDGTATLGTGRLNAGVAMFTTGLLGGGAHSITAVYGGDSSFNGSTSSAVGESISQAPTALGLSASLAGAMYGTPLSFTAAVTPAGASGTVQFLDGTTPLGSAAVTGGLAVFTTAGLLPGVHAIAGVYSGDANYTGSSSAAVAVTVTQIVTVTTLTVSANPVQADATSGTKSVTLTATVNPPSAGGSVQFTDGTNNLGAPVLLSGGTATTTVTLNVGVHSLSAVYGGDALDLPGTGTLSETVYNTPTGTNVAVPVAANTITFATVSALGITTVTNKPVTDPSFPAPLPNNYQTGVPSNFSTLATTATASGSIVVCLSYAGVTYAQPSALTLLRYDTTAVPPAWTPTTSQTNTPASTTICGTAPALGNFVIVEDNTTSLALASSANPSAYGQSVTLTATVTPSMAAGTVTFTDGSTNLGTATLSGATAALTTSKLSAGPHNIQAVYTDSSGFFASSSASLTQTVSQAATTTTLSSSANPSISGQTVTFTATVTTAAGAPTGTVTFLDGTATIGTGTVASGKATLTISTLASGSHSITAAYSGDSNFTASASTVLAQTVNKVSVTATVVSSKNPSVFGQAVTFTATLTAAGTPTGSITFNDGSVPLGTSALAGASAQLTLSSLAAGTHSITAVYNGDANFSGATSALLTQTVNKASSTTSVVSSANPSVSTQAVTFTATVAASASGTPTGSVTFQDGTATLATVTLAGGTATLTTSTLAAGNHRIKAVYAGDGNFAGSTSAVLTQTVSKAASTAVIASSPNPSVFGQSVTLTATVAAVAPGTGPPTGSVIFKEGTTTLRTVALSSGQATWNVSTLSVGNHSITAVYGGDANFTGNTSPASTQSVIQAASASSLASSLNPSKSGQSVTFTATVAAVSPGSGTPTGSVTFKDGTTSLGTGTLSGGRATFKTSALSAGTHSITAVYSSDKNFTASTSPVLAQTVNK